MTWILDVVRCPQRGCGGRLTGRGATVQCTSCQTLYPVLAGVPIVVPAPAHWMSAHRDAVLATLVEHDVLQREPYREAGQRERHQYLLTEKGHDLFAALVVLMQWGDRWEAGPQGGPVVVRHRECGQPLHVELRCAHKHRVFEVEETESGPRPGLTHQSNS